MPPIVLVTKQTFLIFLKKGVTVKLWVGVSESASFFCSIITQEPPDRLRRAEGMFLAWFWNSKFGQRLTGVTWVPWATLGSYISLLFLINKTCESHNFTFLKRNHIMDIYMVIYKLVLNFFKICKQSL